MCKLRFLDREVEAVTRSQGGAVRNPETIVYREDAILPSVVIVYTRRWIKGKHGKGKGTKGKGTKGRGGKGKNHKNGRKTKHGKGKKRTT